MMDRNRSRKLKHHLLWLLPLIFILVTLSVRVYIEMRDSVNQTYHTCSNQLRMIDAAKEQAALLNIWTPGFPINTATTIGQVNSYMRNNVTPTCPEGGHYTYGPISANPVCNGSSVRLNGKIDPHSMEYIRY
jgi:beta-lactamase regulating signal transducer with metallopeptidase domain